MSDYGISSEGFKRKRLDQLLEELNSEVKSIFGDNFNVSPESPDGQINGTISESNANLWEIAEESYNAFNPSAATGVTLSNLVQLNGITRLPATPSRVQLSLTGTAGTIIPIGSLVSTSDTSDQFSTEVQITLDGAGNGSVFANAVNTGPISALSGTVTEIDTPITGWASVDNLADAQLGTNEETDVELRARRERSVARDAQAIIDAIFAAVANVPGVTQTVVLENDTDVTDSNGLPPHSFQVIVVGGVDEEIANVIWLKKPAGILSFGSTTTQILDSQGISHDISFSRPTTVDIYVEVDLTVFPEYPANGDDLIKQAIVDYANGDLVTGREFGLSDDVIYTRLYTPINYVQGHEIDALRIGLTPSPTGTVNIPISATETSNFIISNIVVNS
jgi:uncharacterized phage protein gp47/JayE